MEETGDKDPKVEGLDPSGERSRDVYETIFRAIDDAVFLIDVERTNGEYTFTFRRNNASHREQTGLSEDELRGQTPRELLGEQQGAEVAEHYRRCAEQAEPIEYEETLELPAGTAHWETKLTPVTEDGRVIQIVGTARNITERKNYEEALERTREELRQVIDLVPDLIFSKNRDGEYLLANEATAAAYDVTPEELEGRKEEDVIPDVEDSEQFREDDIEVLESGEPKVIPEEELTTADGETKVLQTIKIPYQIPGKDENAVLGYARDVTELKEYEQALERQRDNLEVLNQIVRHDVRNNLQLVLAYAELLEDYVDEEEKDKDYLRKVLKAGRDAVNIIKTARDVTEVLLRSEADHSPVNVRRVLEEQVNSARASHERAIVSIEGRIPDAEVLADDLLGSVFRNLLNNAVVHNDKEVPEVAVSATADDEMVRVRVADNGPGIPDDQTDQIFEEGEKGLDSEGTGLGLYLVETLVDRYGGDVRVEDNDPEGSVFVVELPRIE